MRYLKFELKQETFIPQELIDDSPSSGPFDSYADYLLETHRVDVSLDDSIAFLSKYGAWSEDELQDLEANRARILWLAIGDCKEQGTNYFYMGE
jgi:hypothetical protein